MSKFFTISAQTTTDELRRCYKDLCKRYHPDKGGSDTVQAQINVEYQQALQLLAETAKQKENEATYDNLIKEMESHWQGISEHISRNKGLYYSLLKDIGFPLMRRVVPKQYQFLAMGLYKYFELQSSNTKNN